MKENSPALVATTNAIFIYYWQYCTSYQVYLNSISWVMWAINKEI